MAQVNRIRVFVASPGDVSVEREAIPRVVDELNRNLARDLNITLDLVMWETSTRPEMGRIQGVINEQVGAYDVFIGLMWRRFGTPSGDAGSGSEEEFRRAYVAWEETGTPKILYYFSEAPGPPPKSAAEATQMLKVAQFRDELEQKGLVWTYDDAEQFDDVLRPHLHRLLVDEFSTPTLPFDPALLNWLELLRDGCRERDVGFRTPHMLLGLLEMPGGVTQRSFEQIRPGVVRTIHSSLKNFVEKTLKPGVTPPFADFDWNERTDVRKAQQLASKEASKVVKEKHLLMGVLESSSNTVSNLRKALFKGDDFLKLMAVIQAMPLNDQQPQSQGTMKAPFFDAQLGTSTDFDIEA